MAHQKRRSGADLESSEPKAKMIKEFSSQKVRGRLYHADAHTFLRSIASDSVDLLFLDPPFNLGKRYSSSKALDNRTNADYQSWLSKVLSESVRILKPGGTLYLYHLPLWGFRSASQLDKHLTFRHWIAVSMKNGFVRGRRLYPAHYALLMFSKNVPTTMTRFRVPIALCRHCGKSIKDYGGYRKFIEANGGVNISDFWDDLSPVRHASRKHRAANELPKKLYERVFAISGLEEGVFVDPFVGSGGSVLEACRAGMRFLACDIVKENCNIVRRRLSECEHTSYA